MALMKCMPCSMERSFCLCQLIDSCFVPDFEEDGFKSEGRECVEVEKEEGVRIKEKGFADIFFGDADPEGNTDLEMCWLVLTVLSFR